MTEENPKRQRPRWWSRPGDSAVRTSTAQRTPTDAAAQEATDRKPAAHESPQPTGAGARSDSGHPPEPAEPVRPLHEEDPYSTPPYGGPGPWAPAPPVQLPQATPPHGVQVPPAPQGTPPHGVQVPPVPQTQPSPVPHAHHHGRYDPWAAPGASAIPDTLRTPDKGPRTVRARRGTLVAGAVALALIAGLGGGMVGMYAERHGTFSTVRLPQAPAEQSSARKGSVAAVAEKVLPGVVTIHVSGTGGQGTGTGFVLDERGHILTNHHVIQSAADGGEVQVTFHGGQTTSAEIIGGDAGYDLAVLRVSGVSGLRPLPLGNSDSVRVGDPVIAIGAPYDLAGTVTTGIISAKERPITAGGEGEGSDVSYVNALQTDASINPGNSGGPLVDARGRVIGINSAIRSGAEKPYGLPDASGGGSVGLGFAIPVNQAKRVAEELINTGAAVHPVIGVTLDLAYEGEGARVAAEEKGTQPVVPGGPADKAGIKAGDVITELDGVTVASGDELIIKVRSRKPGDRLFLTLERDGKERTVRLTLDASGER